VCARENTVAKLLSSRQLTFATPLERCVHRQQPTTTTFTARTARVHAHV
jgi:hypothetical protein